MTSEIDLAENVDIQNLNLMSRIANFAVQRPTNRGEQLPHIRCPNLLFVQVLLMVSFEIQFGLIAIVFATIIVITIIVNLVTVIITAIVTIIIITFYHSYSYSSMNRLRTKHINNQSFSDQDFGF